MEDDHPEVQLSFELNNSPILGKYGYNIYGLAFSAWITTKDNSSVIKTINSKQGSNFIPAGGKIKFGFTISTPFNEKEEYVAIIRFRSNNRELIRKRIPFTFDLTGIKNEKESK